MILDDLITDRTQSDVDRANALNSKGFANMTASEKAEYLAGLKGSYNATDLNRVGEAVEYVVQRLNSLGGFGIVATSKQNWTITDIPTQAQFDAYLADITAIKNAYTTLTPAVPADMENFTFSEANAIEMIIKAADEMLNRVIQSFVYSGRFYSGQIWGEFT